MLILELFGVGGAVPLNVLETEVLWEIKAEKYCYIIHIQVLTQSFEVLRQCSLASQNDWVFWMTWSILVGMGNVSTLICFIDLFYVYLSIIYFLWYLKTKDTNAMHNDTQIFCTKFHIPENTGQTRTVSHLFPLIMELIFKSLIKRYNMTVSHFN